MLDRLRQAWPAGRVDLGGRLRQLRSAARRSTPLRVASVGVPLAVASITVVLLVANLTTGPMQSGSVLMRATAEPPTTADSPPRDPPQPLANGPLASPRPEQDVPGQPADPTGPPEPATDFAGWAILDRQTGVITGSDTLAATSTTASMVKPWLVADYLRRVAEAGEQPTPERLAELSLIIRDSSNSHTQDLFRELGEHVSIERMINICGLTDSQVVPDSWSSTRVSARDTARLAACLADGRAAGAGAWTDWLVAEMRAVRGVGDFGIRHAFPAGQRGSIAIKNGWVIRDDEHAWHISCLAVTDGWAMGVLTRYPADLGYEQNGYEQGAEICRSLAEQHLLPRLR